jgi:hypothetical protein
LILRSVVSFLPRRAENFKVGVLGVRFIITSRSHLHRKDPLTTRLTSP